LRDTGVAVEDKPLRYGGTSHSIETTEGVTIPLRSKGYLSYFSVRKPTKEEMNSCPHVIMTGPVWDPHSIEFEDLEQSYRDRIVSVANASRVDAVDPSVITKRFMISHDVAEKTLKATTILAMRNFNEPRYSSYGHRFRWLGRRRIAGRFWTDTFFAKHPTLSDHTCAQIFINEYRYIHVVPMKGKGEAPYALRSFFDTIGLPDLIISDNAKEQRSAEWKATMREFGVLERPMEAYKSHQNYAENGVLAIKFKSAKIMEQQGVPKRLWDHVFLYASTLSNRTATKNPRLEGRTPYEYIFGHTPDISTLITFTFYDHVFYYDSIHRFPEPRRLVGRWLGPSKTLATDLVYKVLTISGNVIHTSGVEPIRVIDKDQTAIQHLIKEYDVKIHLKLPFVHVDIKELFDIGDVDELSFDIEYVIDNASDLERDNVKDIDEVQSTRRKRAADVADIATGRGVAKVATVDRVVADIATGDILKDTGTDIVARSRTQSNYSESAARADIALRSDHGWESAHVCVTGRKGRVSEKIRKKSTSKSSNPLLDDSIYRVDFNDGTSEEITANVIASEIYDSVDYDGFKWLQLEYILDHFQQNEMNGIFLYNGKTGIKMLFLCEILKNHILWRSLCMRRSIILLIYLLSASWWVKYTIKKRARIVNKLNARNIKRTEKFGITVPRTVSEALHLDQLSGTTYWEAAIAKEMTNVQIAFDVREKGEKPPPGFHITCHLIFDVKPDGTRKARYVAGGHLTEAPSSITYSTVVSRDSIRILLLVAARNDLDIYSCDIQNAYLNAKPRERVYFVAGEEFGDAKGQIVVIVRALYGLKSSGAAFRSKLAQDLRELGYKSSYGDADVWMKGRSKPNGEDYYEYLLVYVDDILCISHCPKEFMVQFSRIYTLKNGFDRPKTFLGVALSTYSVQNYRGQTSTCWGFECGAYINRVIEELEKRIRLPSTAVAPLTMGYQAELDTSELLND